MGVSAVFRSRFQRSLAESGARAVKDKKASIKLIVLNEKYEGEVSA